MPEGCFPLSMPPVPALPPAPPPGRSPSVLERVLSSRPPLGVSALLGFTVFALVAAVLPNVWLSWDLPNPQVWAAAFLVLLLLHAERPGMPRGAWLELWCAAGALVVMQLSLLTRSRRDPLLHTAQGAADAIPGLLMWGSVLALAGLLVLAAHRYRAAAWLGAAALSVPLVLVLAGVVGLQDVEAALGVLLCLYTALLAVRHRRNRGSGAVVLAALWLSVLLFAVFLVLNHPMAFRAYGVGALLGSSLVSWGCLGLATAAVLVRARQLTPEGAQRDR
jgi:hypothetical protein